MNISKMDEYPEQLERLDIDRNGLSTRIVHLGFGAFHRAHQALYTNEMLGKTQSDWGVCEINLFGGEELIANLRKQDHLFTVAEKGKNGTTLKQIKCVTESLQPALDGVDAILEKMAEPQVAIVSMTITEKGYCTDPSTGTLDKSNPLVVADMNNPSSPVSALGVITRALSIRKERGLQPFTVMSCDNVQENGHVAKSAIIEFATLQDVELGSWIEQNVTFPCTMVDRIVPAATTETLAEISTILGCDDPCAIACEPFRQWVIEDKFVAGRPEWDVAGAQFVEDVVPYEEMKLRMLNGTHSFLAYLGYLGGYDHISDTMTNPGYRKAAFDMMMKAQAPSLNMPEGTDLEGYARLLIERFTNPSLKHRTWQIAMDGSQKIPQRMGGSLKYHLETGSDFKWLALGIAGWMRYVSGVDDLGEGIDVQDPMAKELQTICDKHGKSASVVPELLGLTSIFDPEIGSNPRVIEAVSAAYQSLVDIGAKASVEGL
ncbi:mannitol dehydrogenase family protein [Vibrio sp. 10N.286.52.C3]|uniref:mannitol dehydrogenase family protein n=1 Tax=Vibrio sp. 10N.286.52.C3 TaxID=3229713 RepID=UPI003552A426